MKIGVFDSGIGGKVIAERLQIDAGLDVYFKSDPTFFPYGNKSPKLIKSRLFHFAEQFNQQHCRVVVIACNTATTNGITELRQRFPDITFIGVEPPIKPITKLTTTGKVAVMGTAATMRSQRLSNLINEYAEHVKVFPIECPGLAEKIESVSSLKNAKQIFKAGGEGIAEMTAALLDPLIKKGIDVVGIACTHYTHILPYLTARYPKITFYDSSDAVIRQVKKVATNTL